MRPSGSSRVLTRRVLTLALGAGLLLSACEPGAPTIAAARTTAVTDAHARAATSAFPAGRTLSGVVVRGGTSAADAFGRWRGRRVDVVVAYVGTSTWASITGFSDQGLAKYWRGSPAHRIWSVPLIPAKERASLADGAAGRHDRYFSSLARQMVADGEGSSTVRLGWEMTGDWFAWSGVGNPAAYAGAFRSAVTAMRSVPGAHFTFDWNPSVGFANPEPMYPGDDYVDFIGTDLYDLSWAWSYSPQDHARVWDAMLAKQWGLNWLARFAAQHHKRLSLPEWGLAHRCDGHGGGDNPYLIRAIRSWIGAHDVAYEAYFDVDDDSCHRFTISTDEFPSAGEAYRQAFGAGAGT